jgi:hypothetical protein
MLAGKSSFSQLAGATSRAYWKEQDTIALKSREKDTAAQFLMIYDARWPSRGIGYLKLMITAQKGDLDYDGDCDFQDLPLFSDAYGTTLGDAKYRADADMDSDNDVDFQDLPVFSNEYGQQCSQ